MKIIASMGNSYSPRFLVEMEEYEIKQLAGLQYHDSVKVGMTLQAGENARHIEKLRSKRDDCTEAARNLRALADLLDSELHGLEPDLDAQPTTESNDDQHA